MNLRKGILAGVTIGALFLCISTPVQALRIEFSNVTTNDPTDAAAGAQFYVDVSYVNNQVLFTFNNIGPEASSIADVYFDDGSLFGIALLEGSTGVSFNQLATPADLPGGNPINFETSAGFSADSDGPAEPNGVNPGEWLNVYFTLKDGKTYSDVLSELAAGSLRIGIHVQGFTNDGSESFVNTKVPEPSTLFLLGSGLLAIGIFGKRRRNNR